MPIGPSQFEKRTGYFWTFGIRKIVEIIWPWEIELMPDTTRRKQIEKKLTGLLRVMQKNVLADPRLKKMVEILRKSYYEDKQEFLRALGVAAPPPASVSSPSLPSSRIPRLLLLLNMLSSKRRVPISSPNFRKGSRSERDFCKKEIEFLERQIQQAQEILAHMKSEATAVARRQGIYANPVERLKAERLLREIPSLIHQWSTRKSLLEQYLAENPVLPGDVK